MFPFTGNPEKAKLYGQKHVSDWHELVFREETD